MQFGETKISAVDLARNVAAGVPVKVRNVGADIRPPCSGGSRTEWNKAVKDVLKEMGMPEYDGYPWLLDFVWWCRNPEQMVLAVEAELVQAVNFTKDEDARCAPSRDIRRRVPFDHGSLNRCPQF